MRRNSDVTTQTIWACIITAEVDFQLRGVVEMEHSETIPFRIID
jgi:hypothetical protein